MMLTEHWLDLTTDLKKKLNYKTPWEVFCEMASLNTDNLLDVAFMS